MATEIARMNAYKGGSLPSPQVPLSGAAVGLILPYLLVYKVLPGSWADLSPADAVLLTLQSFSLVSVIFFAEFCFGVAARSTSTKASFSPAAAQATGVAPLAVIQANRIHQNHIESVMILAPMALACAAAGVDARKVVASMLTWVVARVLYRIGYCSVNPFWRISGTATCGTLYLTCAALFIQQKLNAIPSE